MELQGFVTCDGDKDFQQKKHKCIVDNDILRSKYPETIPYDQCVVCLLYTSCIYQYVRVIRCMTKYLHLIIQLDMLLKELRIVLSSHCDLVVATVPHRSCGTCQPTEWVAVMHWDGVKL